MPGREIEIKLEDGSVVPALRVTPPGEPKGVVLIVPDIFGRSRLYEDLAGEIAAEGFDAVLVDPFHALGSLSEPTLEAAFERRSRLDEAASVEELRRVVRQLRELRPGGCGRIGTVGFCMGGTFVLDLAAFEDDLATVAFYPFPNLYPGLTMPPPRPLDLVEQLQGPILGLWGDDDDAVGLENVEEFMRRCGVAHAPVEGQVIPGLGHSFVTHTPAGDAHLQALVRDAWRKGLAHLGTHVGTPV